MRLQDNTEISSTISGLTIEVDTLGNFADNALVPLER